MIKWKPVFGFDGIYEISSTGVIKNCKTSRILKQGINKHGYFRAGLSKSGKPYYVQIHRILAKSFIPNPENKPLVDHKNRIRTDNRIENLMWATEKENTRNSRRSIGRRKISELELDSICKMTDYMTLSDISKKIGIDRSAIAHILKYCHPTY